MANENTFELSIIHFGDFHARSDQRQQYVDDISKLYALRDRFMPLSSGDKNDSVGGIARIATMVKRLKQTRANAIFLNAGDCFTGSLYYGLFQEKIVAHFMNQLPHDAITIGNHEFDSKILGLKSYVEKLKAPVVVANVDVSKEPSLENLWTNSTIIRKGEKSIGVVGVLFSDTDKLTMDTGNLKFLDEVKSVNSEVEKLKINGVNFIVVLSHCGINRDIIMANNCPNIDVIIGGHSHTLLYNGNPPSNEVAYGEYPVVIKQKDTGKKVLIVHSGPYSKFVGDLQITFDDKGNIISWKGNPIYLDTTVEEDPVILKELKPWKAKVDEVGKQVVGESKIVLNSSSKPNESSLGNLITDAMLDKYRDVASVSFMPSIYVGHTIPKGPILYEDAYMTLPHNATWDLIELKGSDILQIAEENMNGTRKSNTMYVGNCRPFHWSGLRVVYSSSNNKYKVVKAEVRVVNSREEKYEALNEEQWYKVVAPSFLLYPNGDPIEKRLRNHVVGKTVDIDDFVAYVKKVKIIEGSEPKVKFVESN